MEPRVPALQRGAACDERILLSPNCIFQPADHQDAAGFRVTPPPRPVGRIAIVRATTHFLTASSFAATIVSVTRDERESWKHLIFNDTGRSRPIFRSVRRRNARRPLRWNGRRCLSAARFPPRAPERKRVRKDPYAVNSIGHARKTHRRGKEYRCR